MKSQPTWYPGNPPHPADTKPRKNVCVACVWRACAVTPNGHSANAQRARRTRNDSNSRTTPWHSSGGDTPQQRLEAPSLRAVPKALEARAQGKDPGQGKCDGAKGNEGLDVRGGSLQEQDGAGTRGGWLRGWLRSHVGMMADSSLTPFSGRCYVSIERETSLAVGRRTGWDLRGCPRRRSPDTLAHALLLQEETNDSGNRSEKIMPSDLKIH